MIHIRVDGDSIMDCQCTVLIGLVCLFLFVIPAFFYIYEQSSKMSYKWCLHKTIMLIIAFFLCLGLALPAFKACVFLICRI
ncbi:hypothetical protein K9K77_00580 [Candidatus Babeliales bacterium]|nr:hypothetical protein [Candidatus Babeliales bacterium]